MPKDENLKSFINDLDKKPILIFGFGRSGSSAAKILKAAGADVVIGDDNPENLVKAEKNGFALLDIEEADFNDFAFLLLSPGIPLTYPKPHPVVQKAKEEDIEIICDIELFMRIYPDVKTIGVTGTNGKSTTSSLIHYILNETEQKALLGGNIGTPVFDLNLGRKFDWLVLEISSFQIDLCPEFRPDISVLLNITPDHIDRHGSMEEYCAVKERLIESAQSDDNNIAVICSDDSYTQKILSRAKETKPRTIVEVSADRKIENGVYVAGGVLFDGKGVEIPKECGDLSKIQTLKGAHNYQNAAAAFAVVKQCGVNDENIMQAIESFPGLNHRQFLVRTINGVTYINDSKSTNAAAAAVALGCRNNCYWIVGGRKKKTGLDGLEEFFPRIKHAFLIGESIDDFASWFDKYGMEYTKSYTLDNAVQAAHEMAQKNRGQPGGAGVVLLSPACASFDQFSSFEERGDYFTKIVNALDKE